MQSLLYLLNRWCLLTLCARSMAWSSSRHPDYFLCRGTPPSLRIEFWRSVLRGGKLPTPDAGCRLSESAFRPGQTNLGCRSGTYPGYIYIYIYIRFEKRRYARQSLNVQNKEYTFQKQCENFHPVLRVRITWYCNIGSLHSKHVIV